MGFFSTLLHPDREELQSAERTTVAAAANILQVGEFQLLQLAYREWFGRDLPEALVDNLFSAYMLRNEVPHWARHYARLILMREERGLLDDNDAGYHRYDHDYHTVVPKGVRRFCVAVGLLSFALVSGIVVANLAVDRPASLLPPYFERDELRRDGPSAPGPEPAGDAAVRLGGERRQ